MQIMYFAFRNLFRNLRRTLAIVITIAVGSGALFCFDGFIQGVQKDFRENTIRSHSGNGEFHTKGYLDSAYEDPWKEWISNYDDVADFLYEQPGVEYIFPRVSINGMLVHHKKSISGAGQGIDADEEAEFFQSLEIVDGEPLTDQANGILLGKGLAKAIDAHPGEEIRFYTKSIHGKIRSRYFQVAGVFETGNADFDNRVFRIQIGAAQSLLGTSRIESISIGLNDHKNWDAVSASLTAQFPFLESASFAEINKIWYQHSMDWLDAQYHIIQIIILTIVLLGIFNTISTSILERKEEIGNLRANGESVFDVMRLVLYEGLFLGTIGGFVGLASAYLVASFILHQGILMPPGPGQTKQFFIAFVFTEKMAVTALSLSIISTLIASFFAGIKVCRMSIAKQLRSF